MRNGVRALGAIILAALCVLALGVFAPAQASGTPGCVTRSEWSQIHKGQTATEVTRIIGASGRKDWFGADTYNATYRSCVRPSQSFAGVTFQRGLFGGPFRVQFKAAFFA